jgi:hypothetical protein
LVLVWWPFKGVLPWYVPASFDTFVPAVAKKAAEAKAAEEEDREPRVRESWQA